MIYQKTFTIVVTSDTELSAFTKDNIHATCDSKCTVTVIPSYTVNVLDPVSELVRAIRLAVDKACVTYLQGTTIDDRGSVV